MVQEIQVEPKRSRKESERSGCKWTDLAGIFFALGVAGADKTVEDALLVTGLFEHVMTFAVADDRHIHLVQHSRCWSI